MAFLQPPLVLRIVQVITLLISLFIQSSLKEEVDDAAASSGPFTVTDGASILSLTSLGFSGKIPFFLNPLRILTGEPRFLRLKKRLLLK